MVTDAGNALWGQLSIWEMGEPLKGHITATKRTKQDLGSLGVNWAISREEHTASLELIWHFHPKHGHISVVLQVPWFSGWSVLLQKRETEAPKGLSDLKNVKHNFKGLITKLQAYHTPQKFFKKTNLYLLLRKTFNSTLNRYKRRVFCIHKEL